MTDHEPHDAAEADRAARRAALLRISTPDQESAPIRSDARRRRRVTTDVDASPTAEAGDIDVPADIDVPDRIDAPAEIEELPQTSVFDLQSDDDDGEVQPLVRWRVVGAAAALIVLLSTGLGLVYAGAVVVRDSTAGNVFAPVDDPTAPGYEAFLDTTPTMVVMHTREGLIDALTVLTLPSNDGGGGGVLFVPVRTLADLGVLGVNALEYAYDLGNAEAERAAVQDLLGVGIDELVEVDSARWADLVAPVAPISVDNPDVIRLTDDDGSRPVRFASGVIELDADEVGEYLEAQVGDESDLARLFRHQEFWRSWIQAVADADRVDAVPGETQSGLGRFLRLLAAGQTAIRTLPVTETDIDVDAEGSAFEVRQDALDRLIAELVPFPRSPHPGARARLRILNGTSDTSRAVRIAVDLPPLGTEVELIGNAASFDVETTTISYFGSEFESAAKAIRRELGVGEVVIEQRPSDLVDITVTLGADFDG